MISSGVGAPPLSRDDFVVTRRWAYLNHAGVGPLPRPAVTALDAYANAVAEGGGQATRANDARMEEVRGRGAALMGVGPDDVAFVKNTTEGLAFVANGLEWRPGDRVVVPAVEFPSNLYPWTGLRDRGVEVVEVEAPGDAQRVDVASLVRSLDDAPTRVLAVSWVQYGRGWRTDLEALAAACRDRGTLLVVDAIQGLGLIPARFGDWGVDAAVADGHKWLLGPEGVGFMYTSARLREQLRVLEPGWNSVSHRGEYEDHRLVYDLTSRRFEGGTPNYAGIWGLGASLDLLSDAGIDRVWAHVDALCGRLVRGLSDAGCEVLTDRTDGGASGIVAFRPAGGDPIAAAEALIAAGFVVRARAGAVRASPHGYNTAGEIDSFVETVASLA